MRGRGRGWLAVVLTALAIAGAAAAARAGVATPPATSTGTAISSSWVCPHGGGHGWTADVVVANPGTTAIDARLTSLGERGPQRVGVVTVAPGSETITEVPATDTSTATAVEIFGGRAAVGWSVRGGGAASGIGAEPCTDDAGATWAVVDGVTNRQTHSYLVITDPYRADAVVDVVLYLPDKPPIRDADRTDLRIPAGSTIALDLRRALGEPIVGATVTATRGRVAAASLVVGDHGGVRSVLAQPAFAPRWIAPVTGGSGVGTLSLLVPGELGIRYDATQLSTDSAAQPAGDLTLVRQGGSSTVSAPVTTAGPSAVVVQVADALDVAMGLRESGAGDDAGATAGTTARATAWVVLPAAVGPAARSGLVIANDGSRSISVELRRLPADGSEAGEPVTVTVGPGATASPPRSWLNQDPTAAVLLTGDGDFVALGSGATGRTGASGYATSLGVPLPSDETVGP